MSRGLSQQQRRILGLGVRVNRAVNGGVVVPLPGEPIDSFEDWRWPVLVGSPGLPEVHPALVMHLCHGVPLAKEVRRAAYTRTWDRGYASEHTVEIAATTVSIGLGAAWLKGGASALLAETVGSTAGMLAVEEGKGCVGIEINANHLRAVRSGLVTATARPLHVGRQTQVWEIRIEDPAGRLVCVSRLTLAVIPLSPSREPSAD